MGGVRCRDAGFCRSLLLMSIIHGRLLCPGTPGLAKVLTGRFAHTHDRYK